MSFCQPVKSQKELQIIKDPYAYEKPKNWREAMKNRKHILTQSFKEARISRVSISKVTSPFTRETKITNMGGLGLQRQTTSLGEKELKSNYNIGSDSKVLGTGSFGKVYLATSKHDKKRQVAIKVINKGRFTGDVTQILDEVHILKKLEHPNIVKYYETYDDSKYFYLVMELVKGEELFNLIAEEKSKVFNE